MFFQPFEGLGAIRRVRLPGNDSFIAGDKALDTYAGGRSQTDLFLLDVIEGLKCFESRNEGFSFRSDFVIHLDG